MVFIYTREVREVGGYGEAAVEVLDILEHTREEDVKKIPQKFIDLLERIKSKTYKSEIDHTKKPNEIKLQSKTKALLSVIYLKYWANEEEKKKFKAMAKENERKYQEEIRAKYSTESLFKNNRIQQETKEEITELPTVVAKETWIQRIINKIKKMFRG